MKRIAILGSTGSIGVSTLDVIARHPDRFEVVALCARSNAQKLAEQCIRFRPRYAVLVEPAAARQVRDRLNAANVGTEVLSSPGDIARMAALPEVDMVMAAIVGAAGLPEHEKAKNRDLIDGIPRILARAGYTMMRVQGENVDP